MAGEDGVAAVDRALSLLDAFTPQDAELPLAELAKRTDLYKSTVLRLARSLEKHGYLYRGENGCFRLGSKLLHLGSMYQRHFRTAETIPPVLREIVAELKEGASFYVKDGDRRLCLHRVEAPRSIRDWVSEGDRLVLNAGAAGHVIRAFNGGTGQRCEQVKREMYASSFGERDPEVAAVACPVFAVGQRLVGALAVSGPLYRIEALGVARILPVLFKHARRLTVTFGGDANVLPAKANKPRAIRSVARVT